MLDQFEDGVASSENSTLLGRQHPALPTTEEKQNNPEMETEIQVCPICHDEADRSQVVGLPCPGNHMLHPECLKYWLKKSLNKDCPLCRSSLKHTCGHALQLPWDSMAGGNIPSDRLDYPCLGPDCGNDYVDVFVHGPEEHQDGSEVTYQTVNIRYSSKIAGRLHFQWNSTACELTDFNFACWENGPRRTVWGTLRYRSAYISAAFQLPPGQFAGVLADFGFRVVHALVDDTKEWYRELETVEDGDGIEPMDDRIFYPRFWIEFNVCHEIPLRRSEWPEDSRMVMAQPSQRYPEDNALESELDTAARDVVEVPEDVQAIEGEVVYDGVPLHDYWDGYTDWLGGIMTDM